MPAAPKPLNEAERLRALQQYNVLDTVAERAMDDLVAIAAFICDTPIALVSLVDEDRQWFLSRRGLDATETPRDWAFCGYTILEEDTPLVVTDAQADERFADNPLVTAEPHIRFYAGAPLRTPEGAQLGTLCVIDRKTRKLDPERVAVLEQLARQVMTHLELRRTAGRLAEALERARTLAELLPICAYCKKVRDDRDYWHQVESYVRDRVGTEFSHGICPECEEAHFPDEEAAYPLAGIERTRD